MKIESTSTIFLQKSAQVGITTGRGGISKQMQTKEGENVTKRILRNLNIKNRSVFV